MSLSQVSKKADICPLYLGCRKPSFLPQICLVCFYFFAILNYAGQAKKAETQVVGGEEYICSCVHFLINSS